MKRKLTIFFIFSLMWGMTQAPHLIIPKGHTGGITSVCFSLDGKHILTGSRDFTAKVWDLSAHEIQIFKLNNEVQAVAFSPGGDLILTGSTDGLVKLWKITGELILSLSGHKDFINAVAFSSDGKRILSGSVDATAKLWDLNGKLIQTFHHANEVNSVAFSSDGKSILTGSKDKTAVLWNLKGTKIQSFIGHQAAVTQVRISKDDKSILTASEDHTAILWNKKGINLHQFKHGDKILACDFSSDNQNIATGSFDGIVKIWNVSGKELRTFKTQEWAISSISFAPDGKSIAIASEDKAIGQWDLMGHQIKNFQGHAQTVNSVCFSPDGNSILSGCQDNTVKFWDIVNNKYWNLKGHNDIITSVAFSPDSKSILTGSEDKTAILWDLSGKKLHSFKLAGKITTVGFSPDGKLILTGCYNGCAKLWDTSGMEIKMFKQTEKITIAIFSPDGKSIATGSDDRVVKIYSLTGKLINRINVLSQINSLSFSSDGKSIITGNFNGLTQIWDAASGEGIQTLGSPGEEILSVAASKDGKQIATGSNDGMVRLWNSSGSDSKNLSGHTTKVLSVNFSPDSRWLITSGADGTTKLWDCISGKEILTIVSLDSIDWVVTNPDGLFDASPGSMQLMYYQVGLEIVELDQLKERYYEPGLLGSILGITKSDRRDVSTLTSVALYPEIDAFIQKQELTVNLKERGGGIGKLSLFINNKEVWENANPEKKNSLKINLDSFNRYFFGDTNLISLRAYNNKAWLKSQSYDLPYYAFTASKGNESNANQNEQKIFKGPFHLYAIVIGTSKYSGDKLKLRYPDLDAKAIANAVQAAGSRLFEDRVHVKLLTTSGTTPDAISSRKNIESAFKEYATKATAGDILLVYFSGHGSTYGDAENSQFYYLTKDFASDDLSDPDIRKNFTISSNDLTTWLTAIPARKQVMIFDACHSGEVVKSLDGFGARDLSPSQIRALDRMKDRTGMFILTGSAADKVSFEASQYGQGLLTYSLLEGMSGAALKDHSVDVVTLFQHARDRVPELAQGINKVQIPVVAFPKGGGSIDIGIVDATVKIPIAQPKPVFIHNTFMNTTSLDDSIGIADALSNYFNTDDNFVYLADVNQYENGYHINGSYNIKDNVINLNCALFKGKASMGSFQLSGNLRSIPDLVELILGKVVALLKK